jgi:hypothetical protein
MKQKTVSAVINVVASLTLAGFIETLYGEGPVVRSWLVNFAFASASAFALAAVLSMFNLRWGTTAGLAAAVLSWPELVLLVFVVLRQGLLWSVSYRPESVATSLSLAVATVYSVSRIRPPHQGSQGPTQGRMNLQIVAVVLYGTATLVLANWRGIWDWLFNLRYGS